MYELGCSLGADRITFRELSGVEPKLALNEGCIPTVLSLVGEVLQRDRTAQRALFLLFSLPRLNRRIDELLMDVGVRGGTGSQASEAGPRLNDRQRFCLVGWYSMTITGDQAVYPCCYLMPVSSRPPLDSLRGRTIQDVWNGPRYRRFRSEMRDFMLTRQPSAAAGRGQSTIMPQCQSHVDCPLGGWLADDELYLKLDRRLEQARCRRKGTRES